MFKKTKKLIDVFGQSRGIPLNYVERKSVDDRFKESLTFNQHIVVHGSSKQGKTSLRKRCLKEEEFILIHCSNKWDIGKLNEQILKRAGFELRTSRETTIEGNAKVEAKLKILSLELGGEGGGSANEKRAYKLLELDVYDVNDIIESLQQINFKKYIILEDFHYLQEETQRDFSVQLKAYHDMSNFTFIIVGVWLEKNKLTLLNGDLSERIFSLNADIWKRDELKEVISIGEDLLNVHFTHQVKKAIIDHSLGSVYLLQQICKSICQELSITETLKSKTKIQLEDIDVFTITKNLILHQRGRYESFLRIFSSGLDDKYKELYKWILLPIIEAETEQRINGIPFEKIITIIKENSSTKFDQNDLLEVLNKIPELQMVRNIRPKILDFDNTNYCLNIVERGFLSWLVFQNKENLKGKIFSS